MTPTPAEPAAPAPSDDEQARRRIREDLGTTLIVEAAAGTGKTTELIHRIVAALSAGVTELDRVVAVTFTEKAAGEMKLRLRAGLEKARTNGGAGDAARRRLDAALAHLEVARIGTIHALCADLLRERPVEARVDPLFEVAPEEEAERLFEQCFDAWFQDALRRPPEGVRRVLRRRGQGRERERGGPREALREAAWKLAGHRDFPHPWRREPIDRRAIVDAVLEDLAALGQLADHADRPEDDFLARNVVRVRRFTDELARRELVRGRDHDGLEAELADMARWREWGWRGSGSFGRGIARAEAAARRDAVRARLDAAIERLNADLAACLRDELAPLSARYDELKARAGKLDFLDLLLRARDLVAGNAAARADLQARHDRLFVDEFQDTDPLQAEILLLLAADDPAQDRGLSARPAPGKLFLVGDPKQSIYRFRRADVALYESIKERLVVEGAALLYLTKSFRSAPAIQETVNASFSRVMTGNVEGSQARYVPLGRHRDDLPDQPAVVVLPVPRPYSAWGKVTDFAVKDSLPDAVGAFVDWLVHESGWRVSERDDPDATVPLEARHVCLLFKRFQSFGDDLTRAYVRALEARRIPHVLVGGKSFYDREEVLAVRNALVAIEWPDDELAVYATLRGPFFALPDDALLAYRDALGDGAHMGHLHPLHPPPPPGPDDDGSIAAVAEALAILRRLHVGRNRRPIADTLEQLLAATRAHAGIAIWPTGEQALANVLRVLDMARRFEAMGATSFRAFVDRLDADAESGTAGEAPVVEEGTEGVRIMTVHRAKGLEFPVVVLADPTAPVARPDPSRHVDQDAGLWAEALAGCTPQDLLDHRDDVLRRDHEEGLRLAYVAATRARDLLVVPAVGDDRCHDDGPRPSSRSIRDAAAEGWLRVLDPALYPDAIDRRQPLPAPGCPPFGADTVLERPPRAERDADDAVAPGLHYPPAGRHAVVWWDPSVLGLGREPEGGLRQQRILAADASLAVSGEGELAHAAWLERRGYVLARGAKKTLPVRTVTEIVKAVPEPAPAAWAARDPAEAPAEGEVALADTGVSRAERPHGKRFGTLVHAVLAAVDLDAGEDAIRTAAAAEGRLMGAPDEEVVSAIVAVRAALDHPLLRRAAASARRGECRRETPVVLPGSGGELIEGVVDLAFREEGVGWVVVDFKTDAEIAGKKARYETQVLLYVEAIRAATGEAARGVLLAV
jgi:ATP-dependent exoDNAse (exonuclease V) beta subunit